ncbi:MAG: type II toxin-antitoxin system prevent-host-death family antitoxin [Sporichthyaceae bacterium]
MTDALSVSEAGSRLNELVRAARATSTPVLLTEDDAPVAAVVDIDTLRELEHAQDAVDIAICEASQSDPRPSMTHEEFMALLEAEDAAAG